MRVVRHFALAAPERDEMNATEREYAGRLERLRLAGEITRWDYEPEKLRIGRACFYTPDFRLILPDRTIEFHEVKAIWRVRAKRGRPSAERPGFHDDARVKIRAAAAIHPMYRFRGAYRKRGGGWQFEEF